MKKGMRPLVSMRVHPLFHFAPARPERKEGTHMAVFRVERNKGYTVMSNYHLKDKGLSLKSKGLLSMMLSLPNEWNYSTRGLAAICKEGVGSIGATLRELENAGYIVRNQLRDSKGRICDTEYVIYENPLEKSPPDKPCAKKPDTGYPDTENPYMDEQDTDSPDMGVPDTENPAQYKDLSKSNPKKINTHGSSIHPINPARDGENAIDKIDVYREIIAENISYDFLRDSHGADRAESVLELLTETVCQSGKSVRIGGEDMPADVVRSRLLKLDHNHVEYVFERMDANTTKINNIRAYLLTSLYRAPVTIDPYYRSAVNHDLYRGGDF